MAAKIHPAAMVDKTAELADDVEIGAYAVVEHDVRIGAGTRLWPHAYISAYTTLGARCQVHPFAVVGHFPQDLRFRGTVSYARVGDDTIIREHATIHRGTDPESATVVGARCFIMATAHIGHNCVLGDEVKLVNGTLLAGHVTVGDRAFLSGNAAVHQFVRIGELVMLAGGLRAVRDVAPFMMWGPNGLIGPNTVGLRRAEFSREERAELRAAYRLLFRSGLQIPVAVERLANQVKTEPGRRLLAFMRGPSRRGYGIYKRISVAGPAEGGGE